MNKAEVATWSQSIENVAQLSNLTTLSIALSKLQGAPLKSGNYLLNKETSSGKKLSWIMLKQHLTSNYSEIPYNTHAINAYDTLQQGIDESTEAYLHRAPDILEFIHHTNDMSSITAIGTNHTKILIGLKDDKLQNRLAKSKAKKWTNMVQVLQDIIDMAVSFERSRGYSLPSFEVNKMSAFSNCIHNNSLHCRSSKSPAKDMQQSSVRHEKLKCWHCQGDDLRKDCPTAPQQNKPAQTRPLINKEKQHQLIKCFRKSFRVNHPR